MNQEKARKYLTEIDEWLRETNKLLIEDTTIANSSDFIKTTSSSTSDDLADLVFEQQSQHLTIDDSKQNSLLKSIELITSQIRSLVSMFEKRREQLKKSAYPASNRPVQRVEPQFLADIDSKNGQQHSLAQSSSLIKRESMHKVMI